jgi:hypothetical protein
MTNDLEARVAALEAKIQELTSKKPRGRPMAVQSEDQATMILSLHADGLSLSAIANKTGLGIRPVRTCIDKASGKRRA